MSSILTWNRPSCCALLALPQPAAWFEISFRTATRAASMMPTALRISVTSQFSTDSPSVEGSVITQGACLPHAGLPTPTPGLAVAGRSQLIKS